MITNSTDGTGVSLRSIARRTGVTPMMVYRHFADLNDLLDEVKREHYLELTHVLQESISASNDKILAFARTFVDYGLTHPGHFRLMFATPIDVDHPIPADKPLLGQQALELLVSTVSAHLAGSSDARDPWRAAISLWATLHGIVHLRLSVGMRGKYQWPAVADQIHDALEPLLTTAADDAGQQGQE